MIEEVARIDGLEKLPATLPSRHGASGRLTGAPAAPPPRGRRARRPGAGRGRRLELRRARARKPQLRLEDRTARWSCSTRCRSSSPSCAPTLLGSLLDVAARNRARGATDPRGCSRRERSTCPGEQALPCEPYHIGALLSGPVRPPTWRERRPPTADFFAAKGVLRGLLGPPARAVDRRARHRALPAPGPRPPRSESPGPRWAGSARSTRWSLAEWEIERYRRRVRARISTPSPSAPSFARLRGGDQFPRRARGPRGGRVSDAVSAQAVIETVRAGRRAAARAESRCSTSTATPSASARAKCRWRCASSFRAPATAR